MSSINLPASPTDGQRVPINGYDYVWVAADSRWISTGQAPQGATISPVVNQVFMGSIPTATPVVVKALSAQTADIFMAQDATSTTKFRIDKDGNTRITGDVFFTGSVSGVVATNPRTADNIITQTTGIKCPLTILGMGSSTANLFEVKVGAVTKVSVDKDGSVTTVTAPIADGHLTNKLYVDDADTLIRTKADKGIADAATAKTQADKGVADAAVALTKATAADTLAKTKITQTQGNSYYLKRTTDTFKGNLTVQGWIHATSDIWAYSSDREIKDNFEDMPDNCLDRNRLMDGLTFTRKDITDDNDRRYAGLIAQDIEMAIPEATNRDDRGVLRYDPNAVLGHLVNCVNQLNDKVIMLEDQIELLLNENKS